jgi:hypothetical protein
MLRQLKVASAVLLAIGCIALGPAANAAPAPSTGHAAPTRVRPADNWWLCAPGNGGTQCDNTDPYQTGCASSKVYVASGDAWYGSSTWQVQLYYSTRCGTVWSRLQLLSGSNDCPSCVLMVVRSNYDASVYDTSDVGSDGGNLYSGAWTNQLYLPCGGSLTGTAELWQFYDGTLGYSNNWYPGC